MRDLIRRRRIAVSVAGALALIGVGASVWAFTSNSSPKPLKAAETCNEGVFSNNLKPLERLLSPDSSFKSNWQRVATNNSFKVACMNSTSRGTVNMSAEMKDGSQNDWLARLGAPANASHFKAGTSAVVWGKQASIYIKCKSRAEGSSHTAGFAHPYLSVVATAGGSAGDKDNHLKQDLAQLASRMFFEAQLQTGCQENFTSPSGPPRIIG